MTFEDFCEWFGGVMEGPDCFQVAMFQVNYVTGIQDRRVPAWFWRDGNALVFERSRKLGSWKEHARGWGMDL